MAEQEQYRWLLEPPGQGKAHVYVAIGEGTTLSPAVQGAIEDLITALQGEDEVQGFLMGETSSCAACVMARTFGSESLTTQPQLNANTRIFGCNIGAMQTGL